ncbi:MAG: hypothetical protein HY694_15060 [Deltaproteobacteria bacterium]|nr:hypothetical protein [Deltaproteobacteria bacterium]
MPKFQKGHRLAKGGKRPGAGRPRKAELDAREAKLVVWEREIERREKALAQRYVRRAFKSDRVLLDIRRTRVPDAKQSIELDHRAEIAQRVVIVTVDPDRLPEREESPENEDTDGKG